MLNREFPNWRKLMLHECGSGGPASRKLRREAAGYSASRYLPDVARGAVFGDVTCQDLESLTFPDESFDLVITQDVLEHVLRPEQAVAEIARVLRPGGAHVFTVPIFHGHQTVVRAIPGASGIEHILPPDYHGDSLVIREWGDDFVSFVSDHTGGSATEICRLHDRKLGLDGDPLEVFITRKSRPVASTAARRTARPPNGGSARWLWASGRLGDRKRAGTIISNPESQLGLASRRNRASS